MYITSEQHTKLAQNLFDKMIELKKQGIRTVKAYEVEFQEIIEQIFPDKLWWEVTECQIWQHLTEHQDPEATVIEILKQLKED